MDSNIIISWSVAILTITSLIVFFKIRNKNREKRTILALHSFAKENNSTISFHDHWDKSLIGMDNKDVNILFFIRSTPKKEHREMIKLSNIANCRLVRTERTIHNSKEEVNIIDRIELVFSFKAQHKPDIALEFYNTDYDKLTLSGELQLAQKWLGIVKSNPVTNQNREKRVNNDRIQAPSIHILAQTGP